MIAIRKMWWVVLVGLLVLGAAVLVVGCGGEASSATSESAAGSSTASGTQPTGDPVVIGAIVSVTGPYSALGEQERNVLEMMEKQINAAGGVLERPVEIIIEDDKSDPKEAVTAATRLIAQEEVVALICGTGSSATAAVKAITAEKGIPQMAMVAMNVITDEPPIDWIWRTPQKNEVAAGRALTYIAETLGLKKIAVLYDESAFGSDGYNSIKKLAPDFGLEIVGAESYKTDDTDFTAQLTRMKGSDPEVMVVWGTHPGPALAAKNMKQLGMDTPYVGSHGIADAKFIELAGEAAEGVAFPAGRLLIPSSITDPEQKKVTDAFIAAYQAEWGGSPNPYAGYAFEAVSILVDAIGRAGSTEPAALQKALNETQGFVGPDGVYNYSETNHDGLVAEDMMMVKIEGGTWILTE